MGLHGTFRRPARTKFNNFSDAMEVRGNADKGPRFARYRILIALHGVFGIVSK